MKIKTLLFKIQSQQILSSQTQETKNKVARDIVHNFCVTEGEGPKVKGHNLKINL
jgi:hypothetical protein